jgi:hypothetical protein
VFDTFIYRKIKLIYKFIFNTKANKREEMYHKYILPKKVYKKLATMWRNGPHRRKKKLLS